MTQVYEAQYCEWTVLKNPKYEAVFIAPARTMVIDPRKQ